MDNTLRETGSTTYGPHYSIYPLAQLFKARYWIDTHGRSLEEEIQKRCIHIHKRMTDRSLVAPGLGSRFKPYGLIFGVISLLWSVGAFVAVKLLEVFSIVNDVGGDIANLAGLWALITFPVMLIVFMIGGMMDAERIVKWFNLAGRS